MDGIRLVHRPPLPALAVLAAMLLAQGQRVGAWLAAMIELPVLALDLYIFAQIDMLSAGHVPV